MSDTPSLRDLQINLKSQKRSVRRFVPLIGKKAGLTSGMVLHYLSGFGSSEERCLAILKAIEEVITEQDNRAVHIEASDKPSSNKKAMIQELQRRKYAKHQTF